MLPALACVVCALAGAGGGDRAAAQTEEGASPGVLWMGPRESTGNAAASEIGLVHVEVVVTDDEGRPVTGLPAEAFRVEEDGVERSVETFRAVDLPASPDPVPTRPARPSVSTNEAGAEASPLRVFVIVFDDLHLGPAGARQAREVCERFLVEHARPDDRVILVAPGEGLVQSVADRGDGTAVTALAGALRGRRRAASILTDYEAYRIVEDGDSSVEARALERSRRQSPSSLRSEARRVLEDARRRRRRLLGALGPVLDVLTGARIRKSVLLLSEGFIHDPRDRLAYEVITASQRAGAAISFVDVGRLEVPDPSPPRGESTGAEILATITGGQVVRSGGDLDEALAALSREASHHYILGYLPPGDERVGRLRRIRVGVTRPGVVVRSRRGYWAAPDTAGPPHGEPAPGLDAPLREALLSPSLMRQIPLRLTTPVLAPAGDGGVMVAAAFEARAGALGLEPTPDGARGANLDVAWEVRHVRPGESETSVERHTIELPEGARAEETWLPLRRRLTLPPGLSLIKVAVRDRASGAMGTVAHELEVPDARGLRVSSPILSDVPADGAEVPPIVARRSFPSGGVL
ncbi:MAG: VWA domain-containing protein, partial [Gemmatimonadota bacterium]